MASVIFVFGLSSFANRYPAFFLSHCVFIAIWCAGSTGYAMVDDAIMDCECEAESASGE